MSGNAQGATLRWVRHRRARMAFDLMDSTARAVAMMPRWAMPMSNADKVVTDQSGRAHHPVSRCWDNHPDLFPSGLLTVVAAMCGHRLCQSCIRPAPAAVIR